ncbi:MAG TPA: tetratricopeptide repeat protein, partial [Nitrospiraceae bacterium]|nr:tetratricopeptide repeat protein [Nitrospiraceae bacterium]
MPCALILAVVPFGNSCTSRSWEETLAAGQRALEQRNYAEAERQFRAAVEKAEAFGQEDRRVAVSLSQLADVYAAQRRYVEAEPVYGRALAIYQVVHGEDHPDVAAMLNNLGVVHRLHGQFSEAEPLLKRALAIKEKVHGPDHVEVAVTL